MWYRSVNMINTETQTPTPEQIEQPKDDFDDIIEFQRSSAAARQMVEVSSLEATRDAEEVIPKSHKVRDGLVKGGIATVVALGVGAGLGATASAMDKPAPDAISEETTTFTATNGAGIYTAVDSIPGSTGMRETVKNHITNDPANIDILKDGLQVGESIVIPVSVNGAEPTKPTEE